ncbi:MAG: hypothetical protein RR998_02275 [Oscillospiraceae bacterium]
MTDEEKIAFEKEVKAKIAEENRRKKAEWRESHRDEIRAYDRRYYKNLKEMKILAQASEILAQRKLEEAENQKLAEELVAAALIMGGGANHD